MTDQYRCPNCNETIPRPETEDANPGTVLICPECENKDYQPPAGGVERR